MLKRFSFHRFSLTKTAILLSVIILVSGGIWFWKARQETKNDTARPANASAVQDQDETHSEGENPDSAATNATTPPESDEYLAITEWGVRFKPPEDLRGKISYRISAVSNDSQTAYFEVSSVSELAGGSDCMISDSNEKGLGVYLKRSAHRVSDTEAAYNLFSNESINGSFFSGGREKYSDGCMKNDEYTQYTLDTIGSLTQSLSSLEATP